MQYLLSYYPCWFCLRCLKFYQWIIYYSVVYALKKMAKLSFSVDLNKIFKYLKTLELTIFGYSSLCTKHTEIYFPTIACASELISNKHI